MHQQTHVIHWKEEPIENCLSLERLDLDKCKIISLERMSGLENWLKTKEKKKKKVRDRRLIELN